MWYMDDSGSVYGMLGVSLDELPFVSACLYSLQSAFICDQPGSEDSLCQFAHILAFFTLGYRDLVPKVFFCQGHLIKYPFTLLPNFLPLSF